MESISTVQIAIGAVLISIASASVTLLVAAKIHRRLTNKCRSDEEFTNGFSFLFQLRLLLEGLSIDNIFKVMAETARQRLYAVVKTSLFAKEEVWMVGHPAIVKEVFGPTSSKNWEKGDQAFARRVLAGSNDSSELNKAMLYTGDDDGWRHARQAMTPFFYKKDFTTLDKDMDRILVKHLDNAVKNSDGTVELLNMTLNITIDLVVQLLYGIELPKDEFDILVKALAAYIVPGSPNQGTFPGGMTAFEYHRYVGVDIGKRAKAGTLGSIIRESDMPDFLKDENFAFFLEALTPAFASFWTICHVLLDKTGARAKTCKEDPVYRQQCIKEALRMYPPVPSLWPRFAKKDLEIPNPIYDERKKPKVLSMLSKLMGSAAPIECQKTIKIPKGTIAMVFPSVLHYDDRFWFEPKTFSPERWDKDPFVLEMKGSGVSAKLSNRKTVNYGGLLSTATKDIETKERNDMLEASRKFYDKQKVVDGNIRNFMFGDSHESFMADANCDRLYACTDPDVFDYQSWSYMPFGLGMHACMGRRLALRMVDAILYNFLQYDVTFYSGVVPSMFTSKDFAERIVATAAVYNMPADPSYINLTKPKKSVSFAPTNMRVSVVDNVELRKSGIKSKKFSDLLKEALMEDDSDESDEDDA
jgi:cytochrome P450